MLTLFNPVSTAHTPPRWLIAAILCAGLLLTTSAVAASSTVAILIHGYLGSGQSFHQNGVITHFTASGWAYGGDWQAGPSGRPQLQRARASESDLTVYTVTLPAFAPLAIQADWLSSMRGEIQQRHPAADLHFIGHSAGGVVARLSLVRGGHGAVTQLITIASPHLGTPRVWDALRATDNRGMFGPFQQIFTRQALGGTYDAIRHSWPVLMDLAPPAPGNLLHWLNQQSHPEIQYHAIIRDTGFRMGGDILVPAWSQDMNRVPALQGRSGMTRSPLGHELTPADVPALLDLIAATTNP